MKRFLEFISEDTDGDPPRNYTTHAEPDNDKPDNKEYQVEISHYRKGWKNENPQKYVLKTKANSPEHAKHIAHDSLRSHINGRGQRMQAIDHFHSKVHSIKEV